MKTSLIKDHETFFFIISYFVLFFQSLTSDGEAPILEIWRMWSPLFFAIIHWFTLKMIRIREEIVKKDS